MTLFVRTPQAKLLTLDVNLSDTLSSLVNPADTLSSLVSRVSCLVSRVSCLVSLLVSFLV